MLRPQRMLNRSQHPSHSPDRRESHPGQQHLPMTPCRSERLSGPFCTQVARRQMGLGGPGQGAALPSMPWTPRTGHSPGPEPLPWPALQWPPIRHIATKMAALSSLPCPPCVHTSKVLCAVCPSEGCRRCLKLQRCVARIFNFTVPGPTKTADTGRVGFQ